MPMKPKTAYELVHGSPKERAAKFDRGRRDDTAFYTTSEWRALREAQLRRQPLCEYCLAQIPSVVRAANTVDHIEDRKKRPDLALDANNLKSSCASCHSKRTAKDHAFGRG